MSNEAQHIAKSNNPQILVTGANGFVGSYLLRFLLDRGYTKIRAIHRQNSNLDLVKSISDRIEWVECDILDQVGLEDALKGVEQVYHSAAIISFDRSQRKEMMKVNVEGTANLVNLALLQGVKRLLQVSSVAAIGRTKASETLSEKNQWERSPYNTYYGLSKYMAEQEAWRGFAEGLELVVINPSIILGSHHWDVGPARFFKMIAEGFKFFPSGSSGFVDVRDVVRMMVQLMESDINGERFIANASTISYQEFFSLIANALNVKAPHIRISPFVQQIAWRVAWLQKNLLNRPSLISKETAAQSSRTYYYENEKSLQELGFKYKELADTIQATAAAYLENQGGGQLEQLTFSS